MQDLKIALVQANQAWEDKKANFDNYEKLLIGVDADLIILPEMFHTGFSMNVTQLKESADDSEGIAWLESQAREKNAAFYTSLIIEDARGVYNRGVFVNPDADLTFYDKRKSFGLANEDKFFQSGNKEVITNYKGWKIQLQICYDLRFPELVRNRITAENSVAYDVIIYVANWPKKRIEHWKSLLKARAIENQCYVIGVNRVGKDHMGHEYSGDSMIIDPLGTISTLEENAEIVGTFVINHNNLIKTRELLPFLKDR